MDPYSKEMVIAEWPKEGTCPAPADVSEVKLILSGKVLDNGRSLADSRCPTGMLVTCHLLARPKVLPDTKTSAESDLDKKGTRCACAIQ